MRVDSSVVRANIGGKGVNAARVAAQFGNVCALLPVGTRQRAEIETRLMEEVIAAETVEVAADTRVCLNLCDGSGGITEVLENGTPFSVAEGTQLLDAFARLLPLAQMVLIGGSYPTATSALLAGSAHRPSPLDCHATLLCKMANSAGIPVFYDGKGIAWEMAIRNARIWCIKPNLAEAAVFLRRNIAGEDAEIRAVKELGRFAEIVLLSCGERGCWLGRGNEVEWFPAPRVETVSAVGSGDSLAGTFAMKFLETSNAREALRWGVAAGAANASQLLPAHCTKDEIEALLCSRYEL